jgi:ATP-dependent protease Clp ATPase subunit
MIGDTGVGKTYLIERISEELQVPFAKVNATSYTSAGYVGGDVEDIIRKNLLGSPKANGNVDMAEKAAKLKTGARSLESIMFDTFGRVNNIEVIMLALLEVVSKPLF